MHIVPRTDPVAVIIPVYGSCDNVEGLCKSFHENKHKFKDITLVIVDNNKEQNDKILQFSGLGVVIVHCPVPGSYAARNFGVKHLTTDVYVFTDSDCTLSDEYFTELSQLDIRDDQIVVGDVDVEFSDDTLADLYESYLSFNIDRKFEIYKYGVTANMIVPAAIFEQVGLFDQDLFTGGDREFCNRAIGFGKNLKFRKELKVIHPRRNFKQIIIKERRLWSGEFAKSQDLIFCSLKVLLPPLKMRRNIRSDLGITGKAFLRLFLVRYLIKLVGGGSAFILYLSGGRERR